MTVLEVIQRSTDFLAKKGVDAPRLHAELLLAHVLQLPRMQLYLNFERALTPVERDTLRQLIIRRGEREPLQHILGSTSFCGLDIAVDRSVLIPRPETELLAEHGWIFLNQRSILESATGDCDANASTPKQSEPRPGPAALDFGTGSGCVAVALAVKCPEANIIALDIAPEALEMAKINADRHGVSGRIRFVLGDGLPAVPKGAVFDLVAANPPYIPSAEIAGLQREVREYDPRRALDGGFDGLEFYRHLASEAGPLLKSGGKIMMEFGDGQEQPVANLFQGENWVVEQIVNDYTQRPRILMARKIV